MDKHQIYAKMTVDIAMLSKCVKYQVGTIIVNNNRIVSTGVNGTSPGHDNCNEHFTVNRMDEQEYRKLHTKFSELYEVHSEMNAILKCNADDLLGATLYCSMIPCFNCLKHIVHVGVKRIYYVDTHHKYEDHDDYKDMLFTSGIMLEQIIPG